MQSVALSCFRCRAPWPADAAALAAMEDCPSCGCHTRIEVFPALTRPLAQGSAGEAIVTEGEAACFYHPQKRAVVPCALCGRFLCGLCDLELNGRHVCAGCLETGRRKGSMQELDTRRMMYDSLALGLVILGPVLCVWGMVPLAPAAFIVALYGWRKPGSVVRRSRWRFVVAMILAVLEVIAVGLMIFGMVTHS